MINSPDLDAVQARMRPGVVTSHGFLGSDPRPLAAILADDQALVRTHGVTHQRIAAALRRLTEQACQALGSTVVVSGRYEVEMLESRGSLESPWPEDGLFGKGVVTCYDQITYIRLQWTELSISMIDQHGFYGGKGSPYRLHPPTLIKMLGLEPEEPERE